MPSLVVIGGSDAGITAALRARELSPETGALQAAGIELQMGCHETRIDVDARSVIAAARAHRDGR